MKSSDRDVRRYGGTQAAPDISYSFAWTFTGIFRSLRK